MDILNNLGLQVLNGLIWGVCIALIAVGLSLVFGLTEVINIAHGEFYMLGAVLMFYTIAWTQSFWLALFVAPLVCAAVGLFLERLTLRPVEGKVLASIIITFGLSLTIQHIVLLVFGSSPQRIPDPISVTLVVFDKGYPLYRIIVAVLGIALLLGVWLLLYRTLLGLWIRAVKYDREIAAAMGIPVSTVYAFTFCVGAGLAGVAGALMSPITAVEFRMGIDILPLAFMAVIVGGLGSLSIFGTLCASLLIGVAEGVLSVFVSPVIARVSTLAILLNVLLIRPQGLFGVEE